MTQRSVLISIFILLSMYSITAYNNGNLHKLSFDNDFVCYSLIALFVHTLIFLFEALKYCFLILVLISLTLLPRSSRVV